MVYLLVKFYMQVLLMFQLNMLKMSHVNLFINFLPKLSP